MIPRWEEGVIVRIAIAAAAAAFVLTGCADDGSIQPGAAPPTTSAAPTPSGATIEDYATGLRTTIDKLRQTVTKIQECAAANTGCIRESTTAYAQGVLFTEVLNLLQVGQGAPPPEIADLVEETRKAVGGLQSASSTASEQQLSDAAAALSPILQKWERYGI
jgi:hypothetical protein